MLDSYAFVVLGLLTAAALVVAAGLVFDGSPTESFRRKFAELLMQLAVIVILGSVIKLLIDTNTERRATLESDRAKRIDLLRRIRSEHVKVAYAQRLILAHDSGKTYTEQLRLLMLAVPELEDIAEDVKASHLFGADKARIVAGLVQIVKYLTDGSDEYVRCHRLVDEDARAGRPLQDSIRRHGMVWVEELVERAPEFPAAYSEAVDESKGLIRAHIYADR